MLALYTDLKTLSQEDFSIAMHKLNPQQRQYVYACGAQERYKRDLAAMQAHPTNYSDTEGKALLTGKIEILQQQIDQLEKEMA